MQSHKQRSSDLPPSQIDEELGEFGRPAPIDEDVEAELNAALPEPPGETDEGS
jgi:hypothetical protein